MPEGKRRARSRSPFLLLLLLLVASAAIWAIPRHPLYQEWRLSHLPLETLQMEQNTTSNDARLLYFLGLRLTERKRFLEALPLLLQAARLQPDQARIRDVLAQTQTALGKTPEAFNQLRQFGGTHPESAEAHLLLGKFYLSMRSGKKALSELNQAVRLDKNLAEGWAALAAARSEFSFDQGAAIAAAREAVRLQPGNSDFHQTLAALLEEKDADQARVSYETAIRLTPDRADLQRRYAACLLTLSGEKNRAQAEAAAKRALQLEPDAPLGYLTLGRALALRNANDAAARALERAAALDSEDVAAPRELARLLRRQGKISESDRWIRVTQKRQAYRNERHRLFSAAAAAPNDPVRLRRFARFLGQYGDVAGALRYEGLAQRRTTDAPSVRAAVAEYVRSRSSAGLPPSDEQGNKREAAEGTRLQ